MAKLGALQVAALAALAARATAQAPSPPKDFLATFFASPGCDAAAGPSSSILAQQEYCQLSDSGAASYEVRCGPRAAAAAGRKSRATGGEGARSASPAASPPSRYRSKRAPPQPPSRPLHQPFTLTFTLTPTPPPPPLTPTPIPPHTPPHTLTPIPAPHPHLQVWCDASGLNGTAVFAGDASCATALSSVSFASGQCMRSGTAGSVSYVCLPAASTPAPALACGRCQLSYFEEPLCAGADRSVVTVSAGLCQAAAAGSWQVGPASGSGFAAVEFFANDAFCGAVTSSALLATEDCVGIAQTPAAGPGARSYSASCAAPCVAPVVAAPAPPARAEAPGR